jgi:two-component system, cell cycle response regulator
MEIIQAAPGPFQHREIVVGILLVEDSRIDRHQIGRYLRQWKFDFVAVADGNEAWELLQKPDAPGLILLDWMLPGIDGIELCHRIRTLGTDGTYFYVVMLTAKQRKRDLLSAMAAGADDYLAKPVNPSELRARVLVGKRILELQQSLRFSATHDFLTQLLNRGEILAGIDRELARSQRTGQPVAILLADVDHFKQINDSLGHAAGDEVLKQLAHKLRCELRPYDLAGRYGGEEFLLVLPTCDLGPAIHRAEQIRISVCKHPIVTRFGSIPITISVGLTIGTPGADVESEQLLQEADRALYTAKQKGRNRVHALPSASQASAGN